MHSLFIVIEFEKILLHFKIPYCFFVLALIYICLIWTLAKALQKKPSSVRMKVSLPFFAF